MENVQLSKEDFIDSVVKLSGDEKIIIHIDKEICKDLRYTFFKRDGLQNSVMSYINATSEFANMVNFNKFVDKIAELYIEQQDLQQRISEMYLPKEVYAYLGMPSSKQTYYIDFNNALLVIEAVGSSRALAESCTCGSGSCGIG